MSKDAIDAWFFDLGGTLVAIEDDEIALDRNNRITPLPGAMAALSQLKGEAVFVVSNQASVASGALPALQAYDFITQVNAFCGGVIRDFRFAMHPGDANHPWRKPGTGMIDDLALVYGLDLSRSVLIGDSVNDQRCAQAAGIGTFFWIDDFLKEQPS
ncbi:MAG: HAD-IIIA family hydrolase [Rhodospirillaceae bacterium]|nr:HAD-IIIA family hydrolase [Rhodospirillaceae bacterium]